MRVIYWQVWRVIVLAGKRGGVSLEATHVHGVTMISPSLYSPHTRARPRDSEHAHILAFTCSVNGTAFDCYTAARDIETWEKTDANSYRWSSHRKATGCCSHYTSVWEQQSLREGLPRVGRAFSPCLSPIRVRPAEH